MSGEGVRAGTGRRSEFIDPYETRQIYIASGLDCQEKDMDKMTQWERQAIDALNADPSTFRRSDDMGQRLNRIVRYYGWHRRGWTDQRIADRLVEKLQRRADSVFSDFQYLERELGADFQVDADRRNAVYINEDQQVRYELHIILRKDDFKTHLQNEGVMVIYNGHSRYGRGACFDEYAAGQDAADPHGDQWENGGDASEGLFRLGYPYVAIPLSDIEHHHYHFAPIPFEEQEPAWERHHPWYRHPEMRRRLSGIELPEALRTYVNAGSRSATHTYYGFRRRGETLIVLNAGWETTQSDPMDLGATDLRCRCFCHFGCSSRHHFWNIVRRSEYKNWQKPSPPTERLAYFTSAPSDHQTAYWIYYLLKYDRPNSDTHWWDSCEYAKLRANRKLRRKRAGFQIY